jgi:hypothetical protein
MMGSAGSGGPGGRFKELLARRGVLPVAGGFAAILIVGVVVVLAAGGGGGGSGASANPTRGPADSAGLARTPEPTGTPEPTPDLSRANTIVTKTADSAVPGGDSADRLIIQKANVNAPITLRIVPPQGGELPSPRGSDDVVFYDFSNWPGIGGYPGIGGNPIFSGHVDWGGRDGTGCKNNTVKAPCAAVFWDLDLLSPGDVIEVRLKGTSYQYRVTASLDMKADDDDTWQRVIKTSAKETITLITCGGDFNRATLEYDRRHIVTGERI